MSRGRSILRVIGPAAMLCSGLVWANPEPDLPVSCAFDDKGNAVITVDVDPRCFTAEPLFERYLMKVDLHERSAAELDVLKQQALTAIRQWLHFESEPPSEWKPQFTLAFTGIAGSKLENHDDPVVIQATWKLQLPGKRWRVRLSSECPFAAIICYKIHGKTLERKATLFPNEAAYWLDLPGTSD